MRRSLLCLLVLTLLPAALTAQVPISTGVAILKAEDERRFDAVLTEFLKSPNNDIRERATLAAGRIGDEKALPHLLELLQSDRSEAVRGMAAFAIGEIESAKGSEAILRAMDASATPQAVRARAVEAAGKIAAANPRDAATKDLGDAMLDVLEAELAKGDAQHRETVILGLTAVLRARPNEGDLVAAKFLVSKDPRVRADAGNTLSRLRSKNANPQLRSVLAGDPDPIARANAARALGAADDKTAAPLLINTLNDPDSRVRVSAMRSLAMLNDRSAIEPLLMRGDRLLEAFQRAAKPNFIPAEKTELLEVASALRPLAAGSANEKVIGFLHLLRKADRFRSGETEIALATVAPALYVEEFDAENKGYADWRVASAYAQGLNVLASSTDAALKLKGAQRLTAFIAGMATGVRPAYQSEMIKAIPALQRTNAAFKPDNLGEILRGMLTNEDVNIRATAAELIGAQPPTPENIEALKKAFSYSLVADRRSDDAQLSIMAALNRLNKKESVGILLTALQSPNYLVRRRAFQMLGDAELQKDFPGIASQLESARAKGSDRVLPHRPFQNTRLGQVLNSDADYRRALSRRNGAVRAILNTTKGPFTIEFFPEEAPLTVDNFIKLARSGYFNGAEVHRVVANFVMQDGDPTGTGSGGPGTNIRCEINTVLFERGTLGMALSGKDTGGSQWFIDHSPQPHLDGGYTVFGRVNETGMKVVDKIVRGDKIVSVRIVERNRP